MRSAPVTRIAIATIIVSNRNIRRISWLSMLLVRSLSIEIMLSATTPPATQTSQVRARKNKIQSERVVPS